MKTLMNMGLVFLAFVGGLSLSAQKTECVFSHISLEKGLSSGIVYSIMQDRQGFLWFSTQVGLNRFDGHTFTVYQHNPTDPTSISANSANSVYEHTDGSLWIATWGGGLSVYDPMHGTFRTFKRDETRPSSLSDNRLQCLFGDREGRIWIGTFEGGVNMVDLRIQSAGDSVLTFQKFTVEQGTLSHNRIWGMAQDHDGRIWVGTDDGLTRIDPDSRTSDFFRHSDRDPGTLTHNRIYAVHVGRSGTLWVGTHRGLNRWSAVTSSFIRYEHNPADPASLSDNRVRVVVEDRNGRVWVGTFYRGLDRLDTLTGRFDHFTSDRTNPYSLGENFVRTIYEDRSGVLWIGTGSKGVDKLDLTKSFVHYQADPDRKDGVSHDDVVAILPDAGTPHVWIGTYGGGLNRFNTKTDRFEWWTHNDADPKSLCDNRIRVLMKDRKGVLWVGTNNGLNLLDPGSVTMRTLPNRPGEVPRSSSNRITALCEDREGNVWIGSDGAGLVRWHRGDGRFEVFRHVVGDSTSLNGHHISYLLCDSSGTVWVGLDEEGLDRWDGHGGFRHYVHAAHDPGSIGSNRITCLNEDAKGTLWVGTNGGGVNRFDPVTGRFEHFDESAGFLGNVAYGIVEDHEGRLWIGNSKGISRLDPSTRTFRHFDMSDGLICHGYNDRAFYAGRTADGEIFFGGVNGFNRIDPSRIYDNRNVPNVVITGFRKFGRQVTLATDIARIEQIDVSYRENFIGFEFVSLDFANPLKNQYAYRLEGFDDDWIHSSSRRNATYTNLDPGMYTFHVKASNNDGVWNEAGVSLRIRIVPPFWHMWWFRASVILACVGLVWGWNRYRLANVRRRNAILEDLVRDRTRELEQKRAELEALNETKNELMGVAAHDLRSPLNVIIGYLRLIIQDLERGTLNSEEAATDLRTTLRASEHMTQLINNILDISAIESGKVAIDLRAENLATLLEECERLYRREALQKNITLVVNAVGGVPDVVMDKPRIAEVMDNLLSNAIKYTYPGGSVTVSCEVTDKEVITHVRDTGQGLSDDDLRDVFRSYKKLSPRPTGGELSTGLGLAIVKKIIDLHTGRVWVQSKKGQGSVFSFSLPVSDRPKEEPGVPSPGV